MIQNQKRQELQNKKIVIAYILTYLGMFVTQISVWMTWVTIGSRNRNSFDILEAAELFDTTDLALATVFKGVWIFLPAAIFASSITLVTKYKKSSGWVLILSSIIICITGTLTLWFLGLQIGPAMSIAGTGVTIVGTSSIFYLSRKVKKI